MRCMTGLFRTISPALTTMCLALTAVPMVRAQDAMVTAQAAAGSRRMLVVYRNGAIPGDAEGMAQRVGGRVLHRFGTTLVLGTAAAEASLRTDPKVEFVVEDRPVAGSRLMAAEVAAPVARASAPMKALPLDGADAFYSGTPQGWEVRAVGGFGGGVAGSAAAGPWAFLRAKVFALRCWTAAWTATIRTLRRTCC